MSQQKVLITGGAGFLGSHVTEALVDEGYRAVVLDDLSGGAHENIHPQARFIHGSITDEQLIQKLFAEEHFDYVFHLAAYAAEGLSHFIKKFNYYNNVIGSINLINASINTDVKCFVFTSSIAVYGSNQVPMTEEMIPQPEDPYGIAKLAIEQELRASLAMFGLNYIIFRPHNVYGERQNIADRYRNVVGIFMNQIMQGQPMSIFGDGEQTRAFTYVKDVAPLIATAPNNPRALNQIFNIGADTPYTVNTLACKVAEAMNAPMQVAYHDARHEARHAYSSHERLQDVFDHQPQFSLENGLAHMARWAQSVGAKRTALNMDIEIDKNLPPSWRQELHDDGRLAI